MSKNDEKWLLEITKIICPNCHEHYLIRDKHEYVEEHYITLETHNNEKIKILEIPERDILECENCGKIKEYEKEKTIPFTEKNYNNLMIDEVLLKQSKRMKDDKNE